MNFAKSLDRRSFVINGATSLAFATMAARGHSLSPVSPDSFVEVRTTFGKVRGSQSGGLATFKGIPYGGSVSGANRFKAAPALQPWKDVRDALEPGPPSLQPGRTTARGGEPAPAEDCLVLNVWTPAADGRRRPVMFYSHGGGFTTGSGSSGYQDGSNLVRTWDVVVVATNHRLGLMGYLYLGDLGGEEYATSGNQGIEDIRDGLKWVHDNIAAFGGDPGNVMIFGESGGGGKTSCLYAMPSAATYFNKASIESGPGIRIYPRESAAETTLMVLKELGLGQSDWRKLLDVPADKLVDVQAAMGRNMAGPLTQRGGHNGMTGNPAAGGFGPVLDGHIMPHDPFYPTAPAISKNKPLMVGYNHDEMNFFFAQSHATDIYTMNDEQLMERLGKDLGTNAATVAEAYRKSRPNASPTDLYVAITTARFAGIGETTIAERKFAQGGAPVFSYIFTHESDRLVPGTQHTMGAAHASEIAYKFNNVRRSAPPPTGANPPAGTPTQTSPVGPPASAADIKAASNMSEFWSTFARTGHPAAKGQPVWPPFNTKTRPTMLINAECKVVDDPGTLERQVWARVEPVR